MSHHHTNYLTPLSILLIITSVVLCIISLVSTHWVIDSNSSAFQYHIGLREWVLIYYNEPYVFTLPDNDNGRWQSYLGDIMQYYESGNIVYTLGWICVTLNLVSIIAIILSLTVWKKKLKKRQGYSTLRDNYNSTADSSSSSRNDVFNRYDDSDTVAQYSKPSKQWRDTLIHIPLFVSGVLSIISIITYESLRPVWRGDVEYGYAYGLYMGSGMMSQLSAFLLWYDKR